MTTPDTFFGSTVAFGAVAITDIDILSGSRSGVAAVNIRTSHMETTGDNHTYIPGDLVEGGNYVFDTILEADDDWDSFVAVSDTITVTFPVAASTGAKKVFTGWIDGLDETLPLEDMMTTSMSIKVAGDVAHTDST